VVTRLERRYADFDGLNLTWETLEGVIKHNGSLSRPLPRAIAEYGELHDLETHTYAGAEAQVAALSDDIAYNNHDIDDGLRAGLFTTGDLAEVPLVGPIFAEVRSDHPGLDESRLIFEAVRRMIGAMVTDALEETGRRIAEAKPETAADIRALDGPVAGFSAPMRENDRALKAFLFDNMYRHYRLNRMSSKARRVVKELFGLLLSEPECLPSEWRDEAGDAGSEATAQLVADYIAGMTDRFALDEHRQLFDLRARMS
jgi:dGTPase